MISDNSPGSPSALLSWAFFQASFLSCRLLFCGSCLRSVGAGGGVASREGCIFNLGLHLRRDLMVMFFMGPATFPESQENEIELGVNYSYVVFVPRTREESSGQVYVTSIR